MNSELPQLIGHYLHLNAMEQLAMTMGHREESLKIMAELLTRYSKFFQSYVELTIHRILDASRDCEKEVINASEATASVAAAVLPPEQTLNVLKSIITSNDGQISIAAIKMLTKVCLIIKINIINI